MNEVLDRDVRLHIYGRFIEEGRPPTVKETAIRLGHTEEEVAGAYRRLAEGHVIVLEPGTLDIWMANPMSARPTGFRVQAEGGRSYWGTCVWDGPGVLAMLGVDGAVSTTCPDCGEPMTLRIEGGGLEPIEAVAHFAVPAAHWWDDIGHT